MGIPHQALAAAEGGGQCAGHSSGGAASRGDCESRPPPPAAHPCEMCARRVCGFRCWFFYGRSAEHSLLKHSLSPAVFECGWPVPVLYRGHFF